MTDEEPSPKKLTDIDTEGCEKELIRLMAASATIEKFSLIETVMPKEIGVKFVSSENFIEHKNASKAFIKCIEKKNPHIVDLDSGMNLAVIQYNEQSTEIKKKYDIEMNALNNTKK